MAPTEWRRLGRRDAGSTEGAPMGGRIPGAPGCPDKTPRGSVHPTYSRGGGSAPPTDSSRRARRWRWGWRASRSARPVPRRRSRQRTGALLLPEWHARAGRPTARIAYREAVATARRYTRFFLRRRSSRPGVVNRCSTSGPRWYSTTLHGGPFHHSRAPACVMAGRDMVAQEQDTRWAITVRSPTPR